jgi:hypothetical protein
MVPEIIGIVDGDGYASEVTEGKVRQLQYSLFALLLPLFRAYILFQ